MRVTRSSTPSASSRSANARAARIGPTVCELEGPIPIEKRSRAETNAVTFQGYARWRARIGRRVAESCAEQPLRTCPQQSLREHGVPANTSPGGRRKDRRHRLKVAGYSVK